MTIVAAVALVSAAELKLDAENWMLGTAWNLVFAIVVV